ncbi:phosphatase PAP2 family protein [Streptomyces sp. NPDC005393]|uniref:phosphatase PAP2 family protein n=1 Tax=Streptomyces sp. NPDC005393 TaxID=3157041 RepID=UPI00339E8761
MNREDAARLAGRTGLAALAGFGLLAVVVVATDGTALSLDDGSHSWSVAHRPEVAFAVARGLTATGTGVIPYALAVVAGIIAGRTARQRLLAAVTSLVCLGAGQGLRYAVMSLIARPRPPREDWVTHASGWSFPSGHTTTAALAAGLLVIAVLIRAPGRGRPIALLIGCWGALVGLTRVYLGVHWFTDVIGGWLLGVGWLGLCVGAALRWFPAELTVGSMPSSRPDAAGDAQSTAE